MKISTLRKIFLLLSVSFSFTILSQAQTAEVPPAMSTGANVVAKPTTSQSTVNTGKYIATPKSEAAANSSTVPSNTAKGNTPASTNTTSGRQMLHAGQAPASGVSNAAKPASAITPANPDKK